MPSFGKKASSKPTRLFYATDLHGSERTYRKFLNAGKFYEAQVLIMGGDIIGKIAVPIIQESAGRYRATLQGTTESLEGDEALKALFDRLGMLGWYGKVMSEEEFREVSADRAKVDALFHQLARQRLESWIELSETRLGGTGIKCYVTGGNDDYPDVLEVMKTSGAQTFIDCEGVVVPLDDQHTMISVGNSTLTPWKTPREVTDEELGRIIDGMIAKVTDMTSCVFNFHDPPKDSTLDTCPELDWNTDPPAPIVKAGQLVMHGAGSASVRKAIETHQPVLGLHGHIHESAGAAHLGRTLCVNPGSEYGEGRLRGVLVNLAGGKVDGYQMTSG
jgi:Icc-related predicted phosphoesterase